MLTCPFTWGNVFSIYHLLTSCPILKTAPKWLLSMRDEEEDDWRKEASPRKMSQTAPACVCVCEGIIWSMSGLPWDTVPANDIMTWAQNAEQTSSVHSSSDVLRHFTNIGLLRLAQDEKLPRLFHLHAHLQCELWTAEKRWNVQLLQLSVRFQPCVNICCCMCGQVTKFTNLNTFTTVCLLHLCVDNLSN